MEGKPAFCPLKESHMSVGICPHVIPSYKGGREASLLTCHVQSWSSSVEGEGDAF